ncbi:MAG: cation transporter [Bacteroidetes bacterium CG02_land_8_20_14_3_00_31_25]|nr:MAG: cation transporter [Bacteroidetes bacterium CG02_land_8_20_14_3_00_31_25]PIX35611.1 MAG: cation transporter [Bacteroidetes bacterium CG_4_8_14_3_um_filter_31_14]PIY02586.1 MAG: cation transporter [Bacteroidetes bacterium CG_4_10_14_3_um_filter_31_20]
MKMNISDEKLNVHVHNQYGAYENKTKFVAILTTVTMAVEITFGYLTNSMALLADGWHMSSHAFAIGLTWLAYIVSRKYSNTDKHSFKKEKLLALSGYSSAIILQVVAVIMAIESINRLLNPLKIKFEQAIFVAVIGLVVNGVSAVILHHKHEQSDHNIKAAYLHVLADGLTSITAIIALLAGMYYKIYSLDSISGIICSVIITKWAFDLIKNSGSELIEFNKK